MFFAIERLNFSLEEHLDDFSNLNYVAFMLAGFKNCLALFVCSLFCLAMRSPSNNSTYAGLDIWETENPDYSMLARIVIDKDEKKLLAAEPCEDDDCNWGWTSLVDSPGGYIARYTSEDVTYELFVREMNDQEIQLYITSTISQESKVFLALDRMYRP
ncbi:MAG: hypothetical protein AB8H47_00300 [Bacteroidia bacterium]